MNWWWWWYAFDNCDFIDLICRSPDRSPSPSGNSCVLPVTGAGGSGREVLATYMMKKRELEYTELYNYRCVKLLSLIIEMKFLATI